MDSFTQFDKCLEERFAQVHRLLKWVIGLELFVLGGILAIIVKVFFIGPLD